MSCFENSTNVAEDGKENPCDAVSLVIEPRERDLGSFTVRRALPFIKRRQVGPFVFFDHMGPAQFDPGEELTVRAHPHIGLATITYLFEGELFHKDSLGYEQLITPGAINLMIAGKGIVHAELTRPETKEKGFRIQALQLWVALPNDQEECDPSFHHYPARQIPSKQLDGVAVRVLMGEAYGLKSPVKTLSPTLYVEAELEEGATLTLPDAEERALYVVSGQLQAKDTVLSEYQMVIFENQEGIQVTATQPTKLAVVGGAPVGERHIFWNFVSSSKDRIERAKADWQESRFDMVPGETDFIPLPSTR